MENLSIEQHKKRFDNLKSARESVKECTRELRIKDYLPGQIIYYLGDYPDKMSISPTEYDLDLLRSYKENGVDMIQVHEEWNDTIERYGSDKWHSCDHEGMLKFIEACHSFGIKIIPYCSASYIHCKSKYFDEDFCRCSGGCTDMHYSYRVGWAGSEKWRNFIIPRTFNIMDTYGFDGIFNDWGYDWFNSPLVDIPPEKRNYENEPLTQYDPEAEDLIHCLYEGVKKRGGIYKLHIGQSDRAPVRGKYYDYLWIGECEFDSKCGAGKMYEPYLVPCPDKPRLTNWFEKRFDMDEYFAKTIPFVQFPLLTHGRPTMGKCIDVPGVTQYNTTEEDHLYHYFEKVRDWADKHPNGPYVYSEWSQIPDDPEDYPRWSRYLKLYKPMVTEGSTVYMEIRTSDMILSSIPENVYISLFVNTENYLVASNISDKPYTLRLKDQWIDRESDIISTEFTIKPHRMIFLKKKG
ncbi:MAG: hypothetical protein IKM06_04825 [Clostridia bacterium]|nr:hypothetical protein [Clostridia bacterium]